jgi:hypothetical protein
MYCAGVLTFDGGFMVRLPERSVSPNNLKTSRRQGL